MSLIIESLRKLKKSSKNKPLPPNLKPEKEKTAYKRLFFFASIIVVLSAVLVFLKVFENKLLSPPQESYTQIKSEKKEKIQKAVILQSEKKTTTKLPVKSKPQKNTNTDKKEETPSSPAEKLEKQPTQKISPPKTDKAQAKSRYVLYLSLANKHMKNKDYHKSLQFYQKAYSIRPEENVLTNIIILKIKLGKSNVEEEIKKIKNVKNLYKVALFAINNGKQHLIKNILLQRASSDSSGTVSYLLGIIYEKKGRLKEAEKEYKKAFRQNPSNPYISYAYGRILEINKKFSLSRKIYEHTLKIINDKNSKLRKIVLERLKAVGGNYE